jgi:hypothetical protein
MSLDLADDEKAALIELLRDTVESPTPSPPAPSPQPAPAPPPQQPEVPFKKGA